MLLSVFCRSFSDVRLCSSGVSIRMQRHVPTQIGRCTGCSPLTPPWSPRSLSKTPPFTSLQTRWGRSPEMIKELKLFTLHLWDCSAYQICSLIEFPTHALTSALMSPSPRCHSLLVASLFPIPHFYSSWSRKIRWHSCESGFSALFERPDVSLRREKRQRRPFPCWGDERWSIWMQIVALRWGKQQSSIISHLSTASGAYLHSGKHSKWSACSVPAIPCWLYLQLCADVERFLRVRV